MHRSDDRHYIAPPAVTHAHALLQQLEAHWQALRIGDEVPARADLNPYEIAQILPHSFVLQRVAAGTARFRFAGERLHGFLRMDARGMPFSTLFAASDHDDLRHLLESVFSQPAIIGLPLLSPATLVRPALEGALLLLPMRDKTGAVTRALGAIVAPEETSAKPRRFLLRRDLRCRHERLQPSSIGLTALLPNLARNGQRPDTLQRPALRLVVNNG